MTLRPSSPRAKSRWVALIGVCTILTVLAASAVLAFNPGQSPFNATDATPSCDPSPTLDLNSPTTAAGPVSVTCTETGGPGPVTVQWISDTVSGTATDNAWGQGDKSDCYKAKAGGDAAACVTQVFGIGASKTDLQYHGIGLEKGTDDHDYLYSGIKRLQAGGITSSNANYSVEVNQLLEAYEPAAPICPLASPNTGGCNLWRSPGDLLFMTDWGGNKSACDTATPSICGYVWVDFSTGTGKTPSPAGSTCFNAKAAPCWGLPPGGSAALSANPDIAAGSINSLAAIQPFTFSEIAIDLTESGLVEEGSCEIFKNVWAHSRSSSSFTAELKDFIFGEVEISTCSETTTTLHERTNSTGDTDVSPSNNGKEIEVVAGAWVNDVATVSPSGGTGDVTFKYYTSLEDCEADTDGTAAGSDSLSSNHATSDTIQFNDIGDYYWRAFYEGDGLSPSVSDCDEILTVVPASPTISTQVKNADGDTDIADGGGVSIGTTVYDTSSLSGATSDAGGTVTYYYQKQSGGPADCSAGTSLGAKSVTNGSVPNSDSVTLNSAGTYEFWAVYTGDSNNNGDTSVCGAETVVVNPNSPTIGSQPSGQIRDSATVSGLTSDATGTITIRLFAPTNATCDVNGAVAQTTTWTIGTDVNVVSGSAGPLVTDWFGVTANGTWRFVVYYSGDANNSAQTSGCDDETVNITITPTPSS